MLFAAINGAGWLRRIFEHPLLRHIGFISFSAYLIHPVVIAAIKRVNLDKTLSAWLIIAITLVISYLTYRLVEQPSSRVRYAKGRLVMQKHE